MSKNQRRLRYLIFSAIMSAVSIVLGRFLSYNIWNMSIGFAFLPIMVTAFLCGPFWGGLSYSLADFVGALLFPFGPYFPGFTLTAFLNGFFFGLVGAVDNREHKRSIFLISLLISLFLKEVLLSLLLNSLWISLLYGSPFSAVLISRVPLSAVMLVVQSAAGVIIRETLLPPLKRALK